MKYGNSFIFPFSQLSVPNGSDGKQEIGGGTGFFISADGMVLTNKHVVSDTSAEYSIIMNDGIRLDNVKVLARDPVEDVAIFSMVFSSGDDRVVGPSRSGGLISR